MYESKNIETVCIPFAHYEELVCAAEKVEILRTAYRSMERYLAEKVLDAVLRSGEKEGSDA